MKLRKKLGEISGEKIIDEGDRIIVIYFENGIKKEVKCRLIKTTSKKITINGSTPIKEIEIENIFKISKYLEEVRSYS